METMVDIPQLVSDLAQGRFSREATQSLPPANQADRAGSACFGEHIVYLDQGNVKA